MSDGEVVISVHYNAAGGGRRVSIDRADQRALIDPQLLTEIAKGQHKPWAVLNDGVLTFADDYDHTFTYRIGGLHTPADSNFSAYEMERTDP